MVDISYWGSFLRFYRVFDQNRKGNGNHKYGNGDDENMEILWVKYCLLHYLGVFLLLAINTTNILFPSKKEEAISSFGSPSPAKNPPHNTC